MKVVSSLPVFVTFFLTHAAAQLLSCDKAAPSMSTLTPPNGQYANITITGITGINPSYTITAVKQDEDPSQGGGLTGIGGKFINFFNQIIRGSSPSTGPDAVIQGTVVMLKKERNIYGDGRIYYIFYTATDAIVNTCSGNVTVCVPKDKIFNRGSMKNICVDSSLNGGTLFTST